MEKMLLACTESLTLLLQHGVYNYACKMDHIRILGIRLDCVSVQWRLMLENIMKKDFI